MRADQRLVASVADFSALRKRDLGVSVVSRKCARRCALAPHGIIPTSA
jgi:hypothetical protein